MKLKEENVDIVEMFLGPELQKFQAECSKLEDYFRKTKLERAVTEFLFKRWKEKTSISSA